jgi:myo-inositol catabolism protein IolC
MYFEIKLNDGTFVGKYFYNYDNIVSCLKFYRVKEKNAHKIYNKEKAFNLFKVINNNERAMLIKKEK